MMLFEGTTGILDSVLSNVPKVFDLASTCFNAVTENEVLLLFFSVSLIGVGLSVFRKLRKTATSR